MSASVRVLVATETGQTQYHDFGPQVPVVTARTAPRRELAPLRPLNHGRQSKGGDSGNSRRDQQLASCFKVQHHNFLRRLRTGTSVLAVAS